MGLGAVAEVVPREGVGEQFRMFGFQPEHVPGTGELGPKVAAYGTVALHFRNIPAREPITTTQASRLSPNHDSSCGPSAAHMSAGVRAPLSVRWYCEMEEAI